MSNPNNRSINPVGGLFKQHLNFQFIREDSKISIYLSEYCTSQEDEITYTSHISNALLDQIL